MANKRQYSGGGGGAGDFLGSLNQQRFEQEVADEIAADRNKPEKGKPTSAEVYGTNTATSVNPKGDQDKFKSGPSSFSKQASGKDSPNKTGPEKH